MAVIKVGCYRKDDGTILVMPVVRGPRGFWVFAKPVQILTPGSQPEEVGAATKAAFAANTVAVFDPEDPNPMLTVSNSRNEREFAKNWHHVIVEFSSQIIVLPSVRFRNGQGSYLPKSAELSLDVSDNELGVALQQAFDLCRDRK